ncbi:MAG: tripartite tricarboxylate transporter substrate binding protein [Burkholderiales bacterium]
MKRSATIVTLAVPVLFAAGAAAAQEYPDKPIRMLVGFPPGGAADILGRFAAQGLTTGLGQQVIVDNRGGAGGVVATEIVAHASPNGYTLLFSSIPHVINPHLYKKVDYDALRDFAPVVQFVSVPLMLGVTNSLPAKSIKELIVLAKAKPDGLNYASSGNGASSHLAMELFKNMAGIQMNHIVYKGTGPLLNDLISGQIQLTIASAVPLSPQVRAGKVRGLAVTGPKRAAAFPDVPTIAETVPGYEVVNWFGVLAPAGTPRPIVMRLNAELNRALANPDLKERLLAQTAEAAGGTPEAFAAIIKADYAKWGKVVKAINLKVD